ncbi:STE-3-like pheromone receptor [Dacryopinax primogenitus]|uniref:STE-3-like pheromone receptor n=1 Tax=Dacryopinax primogenitus (strain DJM 731) TaxID=1858805 RepID=M5FXE2_DACPD|nr:STE-3-like pheromone receptor [Dacryopinax primogenitus]EJU00450.1 STE-3-like pheromone receptor [Dacryopinax primogenitus]
MIPHPELPIGAFIAFICLMICLPSHLRVRNVASSSMNIWLSLVCLISGINSVAWAMDMIVRFPIWCDIAVTKILIGSNVAFPAAAFSICRFLCDVARPNAKEQTIKTRRSRAFVEIVLCWVQPIVVMALHYIVQGHRYDIYEYIGCQPTYYDTWAALFIINIPPLVFCFGTFVYAGLAFFYFLQRRRDFELLTKMSPDMNANRYIRLMTVATAEMIWGTPWYLFVLVSQFTDYAFQPWVSWDYVHSNWYRVGQYPLSLLTPEERNIHLALWWVTPVSGFLFFVFFGFSDQAMRDYRGVIRWVRVHILRHNPDTSGRTRWVSFRVLLERC